MNYGAFSLSVTSYVAFLLALIGLPEAQVALHRVSATLLGGAIAAGALGIAHLGRSSPPTPNETTSRVVHYSSRRGTVS